MDDRTKTAMMIAAAGAGLGALAWALFGGKGSGAPSAPPDLLPPGSKVLLIGDSLGVGMGQPLGQLVRTGGSDFVNQSIGGTAIFQWRRDSKIQAILAEHPTLVLVSLGTNDGAEPLDQIQQEAPMLEKLAGAILASGARMVWLMPPRVRVPHLDEALAMIRSSPTLQQAGVPLLESEDMGIALGSDGIHPTGAGYKQWAGSIYLFLRGK